jgi:hypothetical protein
MCADRAADGFLEAAATFPGVGRRYLASFPGFRFELHFESPSSLTWIRLLDDGSRGQSETEAITTKQIADLIFLVSWQEANGTTVVCVQDFGQGVAHTHITRSDGTFLRASGTLGEMGQSRIDSTK